MNTRNNINNKNIKSFNDFINESQDGYDPKIGSEEEEIEEEEEENDDEDDVQNVEIRKRNVAIRARNAAAEARNARVRSNREARYRSIGRSGSNTSSNRDCDDCN